MLFEKLTTKERKQLQVKSKQRFEEIYEKTRVVFSLTPDEAPCSGGFQKCWEEILKLWNRCIDEGAYYLLFSAMYHIAWDRHAITGRYKPLVELVELIEQTLLEEGYAYEVWSSEWVFREAMEGMKRTTLDGKNCKSVGFGYYIYTKACRKICAKNEGFCCWSDIHYAANSDCPTRFETAIKRLMPSADGWPQAGWFDENFIMNEIQRVHGVNYTQDPESFDNLLDVFEKMSKGKAYDIDLMMVQSLSASMVPRIWPRGHERNIEQFLNRICKRLSEQEASPVSNGRSNYTRKNLQNSWVTKQYAAGYWPMPQEWKRLIFDVSMGAGC